MPSAAYSPWILKSIGNESSVASVHTCARPETGAAPTETTSAKTRNKEVFIAAILATGARPRKPKTFRQDECGAARWRFNHRLLRLPKVNFGLRPCPATHHEGAGPFSEAKPYPELAPWGFLRCRGVSHNSCRVASLTGTFPRVGAFSANPGLDHNPRWGCEISVPKGHWSPAYDPFVVRLIVGHDFRKSHHQPMRRAPLRSLWRG